MPRRGLKKKRERERERKQINKEFPGGLVVRILGFHFCGLGSIPGRGNEISRDVRRHEINKLINLIKSPFVPATVLDAGVTKMTKRVTTLRISE